MTAAKEIKVTKSYLGLGKERTNCQTQETRSDCLARRHRGVSSSTVIMINFIIINVFMIIIIIIIIGIIVVVVIITIFIMMMLELSRPGPKFSPPAAVLPPS